MREFIEFLGDKRLFFRELKKINTKDLKIKKRVDIHFGIDMHNYYTAIFFIEQKSRFIQKDVQKIEEILTILSLYMGVNITKKILILRCEICSKAKKLLTSNKWQML